MSKVLKIVRLFSVIIFLIIILLVYSYLPNQTSLFIDNIIVSKEVFFYTSLVLFSLINFMFSFLGWLFTKKPEKDIKKANLRVWFLSLPILFNFYFIFMVGYVGVINNPTSTNPEGFAYLVYLGPVLVIVWIIAFIKIMIDKKSLPLA